MKAAISLFVLLTGLSTSAQEVLRNVDSLWREVWFQQEYTEYNVKKGKLKACEDNINDYHFVVVMGNWCSDSRREVPRFFKIIQETDYTASPHIVAVNREKKDEAGRAEALNVELVPTIIVYDSTGRELGRIVESTVHSLEQDLCEIINKL